MRPPRLEACAFGPDIDGRWARMAAVLRATATEHCPTWRITVTRIDATFIERGKRSEACNTAKLEYWNDRVQRAEDGDRLLLMDVDTFVLRPLDAIWDQPFDVAYTVRPTRFPLNGGVVFLRVSPAVRAFFQAWAIENMRLLEDRADQPQPWRAQYGGINQAAFAHMLGTDHGLAITTLPCREWNCEDTTWADFDPAVTRIVHVKSALRMACVESQPVPPALVELATIWRSHDRVARQSQRATA